MVTYPLLDPQHALIFARAEALENYVLVEQSICDTFIKLSGATNEAGSLIFFKLNNARTRVQILEKLLKPKFYPEYKLFWRSALAAVRQLDETRNQVVHWQTTCKSRIKGGTLDLTAAPEDAWLNPPTHWWGHRNDTKLTANEIFLFVSRCQFVSRHINLFNMIFGGKSHIESFGETFEAWRKRFLQSIPDPPPKDHPLWTPPAVFHNPLQSSGA